MIYKQDLSVKIFSTNEQNVIKTNLCNISLDTEKGKISILQNHSDLVVVLKKGYATFVHHNQTYEIYLIYGGIAVIRDSEVVIITEFCLEQKLQDINKILNNIHNLEELVTKLKDPNEICVIKNEIKKYQTIRRMIQNV